MSIDDFIMARLRNRRIAAITAGVLIVVVLVLTHRGKEDDMTHFGIHAQIDEDENLGRQLLGDEEVNKHITPHIVVENVNVPQYVCRSPPSTSSSSSNRNLLSVQTDKLHQTTKPISWSNESDITSRFHSTFYIVEKKEDYKVCDQIQIVIIARNGRDEPKRFGGDYFRARLVFNDHRGHTSSSMSDGEIVDNGDGTYNATFTFKWPGEAVIRVYLVHSSEAVSVLRYHRDHHQARYSYKGAFCRHGNDMDEERECNVYISQKHRHVCKFTDRRTRYSWYCLHPTLPGLNCSSWCRHRSDSRGANAYMRTTMTEKELTVLKMSDVSLLHSKDYTVQVNTSTDEVMEMLPPCKPDFHGNQTNLQSGHYVDDVWVSPYCNILRFTSSQPVVARCLHGKTLIFLGDSTARHLFNYIMNQFEKDAEVVQGNVMAAGSVGPIVARNSAHDVTFVFRSHGYPLGDDIVHDIQEIDYLANTLDNLRVDKDTVIMISLWKHFTPHNLTLYERRVRDILAAVKRVHKRSPETLVVFRSPNTREQEKLETMVYASDWLARDLNSVLRKVLSEYPNIGFLDAWDMTNAQLYPHRIHPVGSHLQNIADHLLSYICPFG